MNTTIYSIRCTQLHGLAAGLKLAAAKPNAGLPVLSVIHFTVDGQRVTGVATDRYRLFMDSREVALDQAPYATRCRRLDTTQSMGAIYSTARNT